MKRNPKSRARGRAIVRPFQEFFRTESSSGVVLLIATAAALVLANTGAAGWFSRLWESSWGFTAGSFSLTLHLSHWINDGLMALFFLMVGLEIKRELLVGELNELSRALLPVIAALGGMIVPASIFLAFNAGGPAAAGWGIPMATDIAFSLGILSLLGKRASASLRIFLAAFAIADDLGAVLVVSIFYTKSLSLGWLAVAGGAALCIYGLNRIGTQRLGPYLLLGVVLWFSLLQSGVHATVAGVLLALLVPSRSRLSENLFTRTGARILGAFDRARGLEEHPILNPGRVQALHSLERALAEVEPPLQRLERKIHPWVGFVVMPLFAFANAGVPLAGTAGEAIGSPLFFGVVAGLVIGKPIGIFVPSWLAVKARLVRLPQGMRARDLVGGAVLGGIGFTMSLFIGALAFADPQRLNEVRLAVLLSSFISGILGALWLAVAARHR